MFIDTILDKAPTCTSHSIALTLEQIPLKYYVHTSEIHLAPAYHLLTYVVFILF